MGILSVLSISVEVLQIHPTLPLDQIKKKYRSLSILVHPDKNPDDRDRAQNAFEAVNRAWKVLENDLTRGKCMELYEEAKGRTDLMVSGMPIECLQTPWLA